MSLEFLHCLMFDDSVGKTESLFFLSHSLFISVFLCLNISIYLHINNILLTITKPTICGKLVRRIQTYYVNKLKILSMVPLQVLMSQPSQTRKTRNTPSQTRYGEEIKDHQIIVRSPKEPNICVVVIEAETDVYRQRNTRKGLFP